jgi:hypothetical protein
MLDKIQALIDAGNTVVFQCVQYKYAGPIVRTITEKDNDYAEGVAISSYYDRPQIPGGKISLTKKNQEKLFLVQTGPKEYEVFDSEKNYLSGKRIDKVADYDEIRKLVESQVTHVFSFKENHGKKIIDREVTFTLPADMEVPDPLSDTLFMMNYRNSEILDFKYEGNIPRLQYETMKFG